MSRVARKTLLTAGCVALGVAGAAAVAAVMIPTYVADKLSVTPLDIRSSYAAVTAPGAGGDVLDTRSITSDGPLQVSTGVPLEVRRLVTVEDPSDADRITFQAAVTVNRLDRDPPLLTASVDRVTIDRRTAATVEPSGSIQTTEDAPAQPLPRTGLQYRFPFGTEKKDYEVFDSTSLATFPAQFVEETEIDGLDVYHFRSIVENYDLSSTTTSAINSVTLPASKWGLTAADGVPDPDTSITMKRYYSNTREIYVEPLSGALVGGEEQPYQYFARDPAVPEVTVFTGEFSLDEAGQAEQIARARDAASKLEWIDRGPVLLWSIAGVTLVLGIALLVPASRRAVPASGRPVPASDRVETAGR